MTISPARRHRSAPAPARARFRVINGGGMTTAPRPRRLRLVPNEPPTVGARVRHPVYGTGTVRRVLPRTIVVVFRGTERVLKHHEVDPVRRPPVGRPTGARIEPARRPHPHQENTCP